MRRTILSFGGVIGTALLLSLLLLPLLGATAVAPLAGNPWPGQRDLWAGSPVTQTVQYQSLDVVGADYRYLFYDTGPAAVSGTMTITVDGRWGGNTFATMAVTDTVSPYAAATGMITVASTSPYYPFIRVGVYVDAGTITPSISFVGQ
jgi:hypothetical protein